MKKSICLIFSVMSLSSSLYAGSLDVSMVDNAKRHSKEFTQMNRDRHPIQFSQDYNNTESLKSDILNGEIVCYSGLQVHVAREWFSGSSIGNINIFIPAYREIKQVHMVLSNKDGSQVDLYIGPKNVTAHTNNILEETGLNNLKECSMTRGLDDQ